ncbi:MAG: hypothetical protein IJU40_01565 [Desulfovibrionaceae bacterium]|nr:hypothetical protein [Desulfovibrionaceae bacterium]
MILKKEDADLFYNIWSGLLNYVNNKYEFSDKLNDISFKLIQEIESKDEMEDLYRIVNCVWTTPSLLDEYQSVATDLNDEKREILSSWKRFKKGKFFILRHLKKGSIFIDSNAAYQVLGITTSFEDMYFFASLPLFVEATLIPFHNVIITDGLTRTFAISFGPGVRKNTNEQYKKFKAEGLFYKSI